MVFHTVCIATHDERYFSAMKTSAKRAGIDLVILGWGERYTGHVMKDKLLLEYLSTLPDYDVVLCVDAFDSIFLQNIDTIKNKWNEFNATMVISVDRPGKAEYLWYCYYHSRIFPKVDGVHTLNSGMFIGKVYAIKNFISDAQQIWSLSKSNQRKWNIHYRNNYERLSQYVKLDIVMHHLTGNFFHHMEPLSHNKHLYIPN